MKRTVHLPFGFFMNWYGAQKGKGFEYHLLVTAIALAIVVKFQQRYQKSHRPVILASLWGCPLDAEPLDNLLMCLFDGVQ